MQNDLILHLLDLVDFYAAVRGADLILLWVFIYFISLTRVFKHMEDRERPGHEQYNISICCNCQYLEEILMLFAFVFKLLLYISS